MEKFVNLTARANVYNVLMYKRLKEYEEKYGKTPNKFYITMPVYVAFQVTCSDNINYHSDGTRTNMFWCGIPIEPVYSENVFVAAAGEHLNAEVWFGSLDDIPMTCRKESAELC